MYFSTSPSPFGNWYRVPGSCLCDFTFTTEYFQPSKVCQVESASLSRRRNVDQLLTSKTRESHGFAYPVAKEIPISSVKATPKVAKTSAIAAYASEVFSNNRAMDAYAL
jgi:hypothetical protein